MNKLKFIIINRLKRTLLVNTVLFLTFLISCSPKGSYKVLTFFFDGVPDTLNTTRVDSVNQKDTTLLNLNTIVSNNQNYINHAPYQKQECDACHDKSSRGNTIKPQPELCYQCHQDFQKEYLFIHGPVNGGYCTECHSPHMSKLKHLLRKEGQELCINCHTSIKTDNNPGHANISSEDCLLCHLPHGGNKKHLLK